MPERKWQHRGPPSCRQVVSRHRLEAGDSVKIVVALDDIADAGRGRVLQVSHRIEASVDAAEALIIVALHHQLGDSGPHRRAETGTACATTHVVPTLLPRKDRKCARIMA